MIGSFNKSYALGGNFLKYEPKENLKLSIELSLDGFSFVVIDDGKPIFIEEYRIDGINDFESYTPNLKKLLEALNFSNFFFERVKVLLQTPQLVIVPKIVFDPKQAEKYMHFCNPTSNARLVKFDPIETIESIGIFELADGIETTLNSHFPRYELRHSTASLIDWYLRSSIFLSGEYTMVVKQFGSGFTILCFEKHKLLAYNSFKCLNENDYLYYLMYFVEQFNFDVTQLEVIVLAEKSECKTFAVNIHQIFSNVLEVEHHLHLTNHW